MAHAADVKQREFHAPDWTAAAVCGLAAGAVLMVLDLIWSFGIAHTSPWSTSRMTAAIVLGPHTLESTAFDWSIVAVALAVHYALGVLFGLAFAAIGAPLGLAKTQRAAVAGGALFGVVLYFVNLYGIVEFVPWFARMRGWPALGAHVVFGVTTATLYCKLARRGGG